MPVATARLRRAGTLDLVAPPWSAGAAHPSASADRGPRGQGDAPPTGFGTSPVAGHGSRLALFDLDRTLMRGSSLVIFGQAAIRAKLVDRAMVARELLRGRRFARRGEAKGDAQQLLERLLASVQGRDQQPLADLCRQVGEELRSAVYPGARELLDRHREAGDTCVVLSASPQQLVDVVAANIGAHVSIGTVGEVGLDGRFTGRLSGPFCHGPGKLIRLRERLGAVSLDQTWAYSDSISDLPLLRSCANPVVVNPDRRLRATAQTEGWPILHLR